MNRAEFLKTFGIMAAGVTGFNTWLKAATGLTDEEGLMPALFIGHGSPLNALADNAYTRMLSQAGQSLPRPKAIMVISAHWLTRGTYVMGNENPKTLHDYFGMPDELYEIDYPAPGALGAAKATGRLIEKAKPTMDKRRGLDHGAWSILMHMYPEADIPVFQLSIDRSNTPDYFYNLGMRLRELRKKGILIIGSGNITHNMGRMVRDDVNAPVEESAEEFDVRMANLLSRNDHRAILEYEEWGEIAKEAHPSNDHLLPLFYTIGLQGEEENLQFLHEGFEYASISMRCLQIG